MRNKIQHEIDDYERQYGSIPDSPSEQFDYLCKQRGITERDKIAYQPDIERIMDTQWVSIDFTLPIDPTGWASKRPRSGGGGGHFYVPDMAKHRRIVQDILDYKGIVYTICAVRIDIYLPIPKSMTKKEAYIAQLGLIRPLGSDWDNYAKTFCDCIQNILIINDNIIVSGETNKFYSIKPHADINIQYQPIFDSKYNEKRITTSKSYQNNIEKVKENEYTRN